MVAKTALVTGGNSGVGFAIAKLLVEKGYEVSICGRNKAAIELAAEQLGATGLVVDLEHSDQVEKLIEGFKNKPLDVLINNAAIARLLNLSDCLHSDFDEMVNVNLRTPLFLIKGLVNSLEKTKGSIINISSIIINNGAPGMSLYAATKGAIEAMTKNLALELSSKNIRINAVSLGAIDTPMFQKLGLDRETLKSLRSEKETMIPLLRYGRPEEVAKVVIAQIESTYTTGSIWTVDGGVSVC
jgi:NAD(P)-dependent dehydrogenase (short-subunit alcohol dehydrogenase family)